jgi:GT2 family glycosyltransferase
MKRTESLSVGVSIVLYRTHVREIEPLVQELLQQGASRIYLVDNSPLSFDTFGKATLPELVTTIRVGRNLGYGAGHNIAIQDSIRHHRYHLVSNPDIRLAGGVLRGLHAVMDARPDVGLVMPEVVGPDGSRHHLCKRAPSPLDYVPSWLAPQTWRARRRAHLEMRDSNYDSELSPQCLSGCFMFLRSSVVARSGAFDERFFMYFEDFDLSRRIGSVARNLYYPSVRVIHEHRSEHRRSLRLLAAFGSSAVKYFGKWGWLESPESRAGVTSSLRKA